MQKQGYIEQEVEFESNGATVYGTLTLPRGKRAERAFTILHSDERGGRDSEYYAVMAPYFAERGVAVLRYDSPGSGSSPGKAFTQTMAERANEARAANELLRRLTGLDEQRVGLWGLSEGSLISLLAGSEHKDEFAFLVLASADYEAWTAAKMLSDIEEECRDEGLDEARIARELLMVKLWIAYYKVQGGPAYDLASLAREAAALGSEEGPWVEVLALLNNLEQLTPEEECRKIYELIKSFHAKWSDYKYGYIYINDIADNELDAGEMVVNKEIWQNMTSINPYDLAAKVSCPVYAVWGENDDYMDAGLVCTQYSDFVKVKGLSKWQLKVYPNANHSIAAEDGSAAPHFFDETIEWIFKIE